MKCFGRMPTEDSFRDNHHQFLSTLHVLAQKFTQICCLGGNWASHTNTGPLRGDGAMEADLWFIHWVHCFWTSVFMDIKNALLRKTGWFWINTVLEHTDSVHWQVWFIPSCRTHLSTPLFWCLWRVINVCDYMSCLNKMRCTLHDRVTDSIKMHNLNTAQYC